MSGMKITIGFITARDEPQLHWLIGGLAEQAKKSDEFELIVVDALGRPAAAIGYVPIRAITKIVETRPKPTIWQGPHRITEHDFFANANARNTALALCTTDYICFVDDRCRIDRKWLDEVRRGEKKRESVLCGPCDKHEDSGHVLDHRRQISPRGKKGCSGGWCFGANHALPLEWALDVNGFEEGCDPVGLEDCTFGHMLENAGRRIDFVAEMSLQQDRKGFSHPFGFPRHDKGQSPNDKSHALQKRFYGRTRTEFTPDLRAMRQQISQGQPFPLPNINHRDWYDDTLVKGTSLPVADRVYHALGRNAETLLGYKPPSRDAK